MNVAYARTAGEESRIESALDAAGIAYSFALDAVAEDSEGTACSLARVYSVEPSDAGRARAALQASGLMSRLFA